MAEKPPSSLYDLYGFFSPDEETRRRALGLHKSGAAGFLTGIGGIMNEDGNEKEKEKEKRERDQQNSLIRLTTQQIAQLHFSIADSIKKYNEAEDRRRDWAKKFETAMGSQAGTVASLKRAGILMIAHDIELDSKENLMQVEVAVFRDSNGIYCRLGPKGEKIYDFSADQIAQIESEISAGKGKALTDNSRPWQKKVAAKNAAYAEEMKIAALKTAEADTDAQNAKADVKNSASTLTENGENISTEGTKLLNTEDPNFTVNTHEIQVDEKGYYYIDRETGKRHDWSKEEGEAYIKSGGIVTDNRNPKTKKSAADMDGKGIKSSLNDTLTSEFSKVSNGLVTELEGDIPTFKQTNNPKNNGYNLS